MEGLPTRSRHAFVNCVAISYTLCMSRSPLCSEIAALFKYVPNYNTKSSGLNVVVATVKKRVLDTEDNTRLKRIKQSPQLLF